MREILVGNGKVKVKQQPFSVPHIHFCFSHCIQLFHIPAHPSSASLSSMPGVCVSLYNEVPPPHPRFLSVRCNNKLHRFVCPHGLQVIFVGTSLFFSPPYVHLSFLTACYSLVSSCCVRHDHSFSETT